MKILNLRLKKFIGILKGLDIEEVTIDFSDLSGLVSLSGQNGAGKSTILDCCQPYSRLASRKGALQQHTYGRDAEKELSFEFQGDVYRTLIKIDSESNRTEGFLWRNGESLCDGKISNYNKLITELCGSPELFFNSVFCSQNSRKLSDLTTGELKKLFSEFLKLNLLEQYEDTSKQCANVLTSRTDSLDREIETLKDLADKYPATVDTLTFLKEQKAKLKQRLLELTFKLENSEADLIAAQANTQKNELIETEVIGLQNTHARLSSEIENDQKQSQVELDELRIKYKGFKSDILALENLLANRDEIVKASAEKERLTQDINKLRDAAKKLSREHLLAVGATSKKETEKAETVIKQVSEISSAKNNQQTLILKLEQAKSKTTDLDKRDPDCVSTTCSFILSALSAQQDIPVLKRIVGESIERASILEQAYLDMQNLFSTQISTLKAEEKAIRTRKEDTEVNIAQFEDNLERVTALADELPAVKTALSRKQDLEKRQAENIADGKKTKDFWEKRIIEKKGEQFHVATAIEDKKAAIDTKSAKLEDSVKEEISAAKNAIAGRTDGIADLATNIALSEKDVEIKKQATKDLDSKLNDREIITTETSDWLYLKTACSAKGLRALEIDSTAPAISAYANELLINTFGSAFTVKFRTQNEEGREVLDILVIGGDGSEILLDNMSGGQKVYILKALRLAMTLIAQEKGGLDMKTAFADEEDGALDVENAKHFINLYRSFMISGGFESCYFISHKPDCVAMADHILTFKKGGITIE